MRFHLEEVTEAIEKINPILKHGEPYEDGVEEMVDAILKSCIQVISMAYLKAVSEGFVFESWCKQSNAFKDFFGLYGEFCSHITQLCMDDMEADDMLVDVLTKLRIREV